MRQTEPSPETNLSESSPSLTEEKLRREIDELKRQLAGHGGHGGDPSHSPLQAKAHAARPSTLFIALLCLLVVAAVIGAFTAGYIPLKARDETIQKEALTSESTLPSVDVIEVGRGPATSEIELPGNLEALTEAPVLARADGYIRKRNVDIGDRVKAGQMLAEIEAPEVDQQIRQAKANSQQAQASMEQAQANLEQGKANMELAGVTAERWASLVAQGVVSKQDNDQYQAQYKAQQANVQALEKAISAQRSNIAAAEANLERLNEVQGYRIVRAPFDGVITLRNVDVGALVNLGNTLLFRIAQTATLRAFVNVPENNSNSVQPGQRAELTVASINGRRFLGTVARTANSLDPASRTLLTELQVPNPDGALMPGMYAQVSLSSARANAPLVIPSDALIARGNGTQVAIVRGDHSIHLQSIQTGRDFGDHLEVLSGLSAGDLIIPYPSDTVQEGSRVEPTLRADKPVKKPAAKSAGTSTAK